jgi:hypothetical protein
MLRVGQEDCFAKVVADVSALFRPLDFDKYLAGGYNYDWLVAVDNFAGGVSYWRISLGTEGDVFILPTNSACEVAVNGSMLTARTEEDALRYLGTGVAQHDPGLIFRTPETKLTGVAGLAQAFEVAAGRAGLEFDRVDNSEIGATIVLFRGAKSFQVSMCRVLPSLPLTLNLNGKRYTLEEFQKLTHALAEIYLACKEAQV